MVPEAEIGSCTYTFFGRDNDSSQGGTNILTDTYTVTYYPSYCNHAPTWDSTLTAFEFEVAEDFEIILPPFSDHNPQDTHAVTCDIGTIEYEVLIIVD